MNLKILQGETRNQPNWNDVKLVAELRRRGMAKVMLMIAQLWPEYDYEVSQAGLRNLDE